MKLIKEYKNEEIPKTYITMIMSNTIFLAVHIYCIQILYGVLVELTINVKLLLTGFMAASTLLPLAFSVIIYLFCIPRYFIIQFRKTINNNIENSHLSFVQHFLLTNCLLLIFNLVLIKTL